MREKMASSRFLLLTALSCCVCGLELNVTQSFYQAEETQSVTMDWTFSPRPDPSLQSLFILCSLYRHTDTVLFYFQDGFEIPTEDEEFSERVWVDKDVLREGRIRLHVSSLRVNDSGEYSCEVHAESDTEADGCYLTVTAATSDRGLQQSDEDMWIWIVFFGLTLIVSVVVCVMSGRTGLPLGTSQNLASCVCDQVCCQDQEGNPDAS